MYLPSIVCVSLLARDDVETVGLGDQPLEAVQ